MLKAACSTSADLIGKHLGRELHYKESLYRCQPQVIREFITTQARHIAQDIIDEVPRICYWLPDYIVLQDEMRGTWHKAWIAPRYRKQHCGSHLLYGAKKDIPYTLIKRFEELQSSANIAVATCAEILRYRVALELLPTMPDSQNEFMPPDDIILQNMPFLEVDLGQVYKSFYKAEIPHWNSYKFDEKKTFPNEDCILIGLDNYSLSAMNTTDEQFMSQIYNQIQLLATAFVIEPAVLEEARFQSFYSSVIHQWVIQCQAYVENLMKQIIQKIQRRVAENSLNRGLSLSLPYFDYQAMQINNLEIEIIPKARIPFRPEFIFQAVQETKEKINNDSKLDTETRSHLMEELDLLDKSFSINCCGGPKTEENREYPWNSQPSGNRGKASW